VPSRHEASDSLNTIIGNGERIALYTAGLNQEAFGADGRTRDAVERCLERICEAAHRLGSNAETMMPDQPWRDIRGMGNRLRHGYDRISLDIIWNAIRHDVPALLADARQALKRLP
jgi:uncharacterized protein with HEPN domain